MGRLAGRTNHKDLSSSRDMITALKDRSGIGAHCVSIVLFAYTRPALPVRQTETTNAHARFDGNCGRDKFQAKRHSQSLDRHKASTVEDDTDDVVRVSSNLVQCRPLSLDSRGVAVTNLEAGRF